MKFNANNYRFESRSLNAHTKKKKAIPVGMTFSFLVRENITDYFTLQLLFNGTEHTFSIKLTRCHYEESKNQIR